MRIHRRDLRHWWISIENLWGVTLMDQVSIWQVHLVIHCWGRVLIRGDIVCLINCRIGKVREIARVRLIIRGDFLYRY